MKNDKYELLIKRIKSLCEKENITVYRIAKNSGINPRTLNNLMNGTFKDPRFSTIVNICNGLNISLNDFFNDNIFK